MTLKIDESLVSAINARQIKLDSLKKLISFALSGYEDISEQDVCDLKEEYLEIYTEYELLKNKVQEIIKRSAGSDFINWSLDFTTKEATYETA